jgi:PAS domain S-box-containing protein
MDAHVNASEENRRIRRAMRDLVALSTLPAIWIGLDDEGVARSLADVLLSTLSLDLIYVRLPKRTGKDAVEVVRSRQQPDLEGDPAVRTALAPLLNASRGEAAPSIHDPFGSGTLRAATARFGGGDDHGIVVACSRSSDFPTEQDRLLLGVGANQTAVVVQRRQAEDQILEQREWLQVTLASIGDAVITTDIDGRITYLNRVAEDLTGWTSAEALGRPVESVFTILNEETREPAENPVMSVLQKGNVVGLANHTLLIAKDGSVLPIDDSAAPIRSGTGAMIGVVMVFRGVADQRKAEQRRNVRLAVIQVLNEAPSVQAMTRGTLQAACEGLGLDAGLFWAVDDEGDCLVCRASWNKPDSPAPDFEKDSRNRKFKRGEGIPGRVWASSQPVWITDLSRDAHLPRFATAHAHGLSTAFACPVVIGNHPHGVMEFFSRRLREPDFELLETMATVATSVGQYIERKTAEDDLRRSEAQLAEFFENATVGLHWVGADGTILRANRAELEMLGYNREEYVGRPISDFHADEEVICDILDKLNSGERLVEYPARMRCKNGLIKDVLIDSSVMWKDGKFVHTRCFTRDVTEKKRAEMALAEARSQLDAALEAGAIATWTWDIPNNRLFAGAHLTRLFNLPPSDANGRVLDAYIRSIHPDDLPNVTAALDRAVETGADYEADYRIVQADGSLRWVSARGRSQLDSAGKPVRMPGVLVDITERKRLEHDLRARLDELAAANRRKEELLASLKESEQKLRLLADTIPQLAWTARPDGFIFWYNRRWYEYTGCAPEQMEGWGWQSVHDAAVLPEVLDRWKRCIDTGESFEMIFPLKGADGAFRPFLTRVNPLRDVDGGILYWFGTCTDISDIKRMEEALREADRRKDEFLATLAHELRNPLAPIRNSLQILKMPHVDAATVQQVKDLMERQVHALVRLVDDLLDVARVMRGKIELRKEPVELATVIAHAAETVHSLIELQGQHLDVCVSPESLLVDADPVRLAQVVSNLLTNSAKYTEANGHIWVTARREGDEAVLRVRDDGIGIAPDVLPHVFELFVQADHSSTKAHGGLGIGLTLAKNLTQLHDGSIEADSPGVGRGSQFTVRLPLVIHPRGDSNGKLDDAPRHEASSASHRLLVVDDNEDAAMSLAMLLRLQGHEVRTAHDGPSAVALAASFLPNLVFLDLGMPDMDGYEVARLIRRQPGLERVVLAALTGWGQEEDHQRTAAAGFDYHLVKPPERKSLDRVMSHLNRLRDSSVRITEQG